jgi:hypothetical protein
VVAQDRHGIAERSASPNAQRCHQPTRQQDKPCDGDEGTAHRLHPFVVANSHSNKEEQPDASIAFAEKPTLLLTFCWSGY